jgi:thioredoxin reductase (NADPH)
MSRYLIRRIEESPDDHAAPVHRDCRSRGDAQLERVTWRTARRAKTEGLPIRHVLPDDGAVPNTAWLDGCLVTDAKGFIKAGTDLTPEELAHATLAAEEDRRSISKPACLVFSPSETCGGKCKRWHAVGEGSCP